MAAHGGVGIAAALGEKEFHPTALVVEVGLQRERQHLLRRVPRRQHASHAHAVHLHARRDGVVHRAPTAEEATAVEPVVEAIWLGLELGLGLGLGLGLEIVIEATARMPRHIIGEERRLYIALGMEKNPSSRQPRLPLATEAPQPVVEPKVVTHTPRPAGDLRFFSAPDHEKPAPSFGQTRPISGLGRADRPATQALVSTRKVTAAKSAAATRCPHRRRRRTRPRAAGRRQGAGRAR